MSIDSAERRRLFLANAFATAGERRLAAIIAAATFGLFAAVVPFVRVPLAQFPAFIPSYEAALFFIDLITAVLLYEQFVRVRLPALLVLASGYLFDAMLIVPHALSFPGAFAASGLLGGGPQTTAWLYTFWHGGFPLFVIGYALLRRRNDREAAGSTASLAIIAAIVGVAALALLLLMLATSGHDHLPVIMQGPDYSLMVTKGVSPAIWLITFAACIALWPSRERVMDLWLLVVMWVWLYDIALSAVIGSSRFDLGFYAGRIFGLIAASFLLVTLMVEVARLYAGAISAVEHAEHRLADLMRRQARADTFGVDKQEGAFVLRQNIVRFQSLLAARTADDPERASIAQLLAEEEAKLRTVEGEGGALH